MIEWFNNIVEIGYEHFLLGLGWTADSVIIEDWNVCKRVLNADNLGKWFTELVPFFNINTFPFVL